MRGGGHSFDAQPIGDDLVVSTERLNSIELLDGDRVRVGPGATWGEIFAATQPHGLVPAGTVTTEHATAGGTLSADCLSRFSMAYGKEGNAGSTRLRAAHSPKESFSRVLPAALTEASWNELDARATGLPRGDRRLRLSRRGRLDHLPRFGLAASERRPDRRAQLRPHLRDFDRLTRDLLPDTGEGHQEDSDPNDPEKLDAIWSAISPALGEAIAMLSLHLGVHSRARAPAHDPAPAEAPGAGSVRMAASRRLDLPAALVADLSHRLSAATEYIDDLEGFTFFMDGNVRAKRVGRRLGFSMRNIQQTFVVPFDETGRQGWEAGHDSLVDWLERAQALLDERGLTPTLLDVLFLPATSRSCSPRRPAGRDSRSAMRSRRPASRRFERCREAFNELADLLWDGFGGRVHLVKNVFASKQTLAKMYGEGAERFFALKSELDPAGILRNDFLERTLGGLDEGRRARLSAITSSADPDRSPS